MITCQPLNESPDNCPSMILVKTIDEFEPPLNFTFSELVKLLLEDG
jgi:hypothetical protein